MEYYGWMGKILHIDLTNEVVRTEALDLEMARKYVGGLGFGVKILYDEVLPGMDAFDPEVPIVFTTGPLTATDVPSCGSYVVIAKSPLTNTIAQAEANGFFGLRLKSAGYDAVVVRGKAKKPVYLWINNDQVEIRDASNVWGHNTHETEELLKTETGAKNASVACIGAAGENLVRYAAIESDFGHIASSGGCGAVMGSKNLKAIVAFGNQKPQIADPERTKEILVGWKQAIVGAHFTPTLKQFGTGGMMQWLNEIGDLPTKNLTTNVFPEVKEIDGVAIRTKLETSVKPCYKCPINHVHSVQLPQDKHGGMKVEEPESEGLVALGSNLGISDLVELLYLHDIADADCMDIKTLGFVISLCMECYEKGVITKEQLDGIDLTWGNSEGAAQLMHKISHREGVGALLGENLYTIAETFGGEALNMVVSVKGAGIHVHDIRSMWGFTLTHAITDFGGTTSGSNVEFGPDLEIGFDHALDPGKRDDHAIAAMRSIPAKLFMDVASVCAYNFGTNGVPLEVGVEALAAITGVDFTKEEFEQAMYRIENLARAFNIRHGATAADDTVSERLMSGPVDGPAKGRSSKPYLAGMVKEYYRYMGWDEKTSKPLRSTLKKLDLDYVIADLWE